MGRVLLELFSRLARHGGTRPRRALHPGYVSDMPVDNFAQTTVHEATFRNNSECGVKTAIGRNWRKLSTWWGVSVTHLSWCREMVTRWHMFYYSSSIYGSTCQVLGAKMKWKKCFPSWNRDSNENNSIYSFSPFLCMLSSIRWQLKYWTSQRKIIPTTLTTKNVFQGRDFSRHQSYTTRRINYRKKVSQQRKKEEEIYWRKASKMDERKIFGGNGRYWWSG